MKITDAWFRENIDTRKGKSLSSEQFKLLLKWFPDLFVYTNNGTQIKKGWKTKLLGREISPEQTLIFYNKSFFKDNKKAKQSRHIKYLIKNGEELSLCFYNKLPEHPHNRLISLVGHIPDIDLIQVFYTENGSTIIEFAYIMDDEEKFFTLTCNAFPINNTKPYQFYTYLFKGIKDNFSNKIYKDFTGKDIVECLKSLKKTKKVVVIKKRNPVVSFPANTSKKERKAKIKEIKAQDKAMCDRVVSLFMNDFEEFNRKLKMQGEPEVSLIEFGNMCDIDISSIDGLARYKGLPTKVNNK